MPEQIKITSEIENINNPVGALNCEEGFKKYWSQHNYNEAVKQLQISYSWLQKYGETSVPFSTSMLECSYLKNFYGTPAADMLSYDELISFWLNEHTKAIDAVAGMIKDETEYQNFLKNQVSLNDIFNRVAQSVSDVFSFLSQPVILFSILGLIGLYLIKK